MKTVFSGIQPSGDLHLGNFLGAVRNWVSLQDRYRCIICIVDYHAITQDYDPKDMGRRVTDIFPPGHPLRAELPPDSR